MHGDRPGLAGIDNRDAKRQGRGERRRDAADLGGHDLVGAQVSEAGSQGPADGKHQSRVHLVVNEAIHLEDAVAHIDALAQNAVLQQFHVSFSLYQCCL